jgi:hypothetical protein
MIRCLLVGQTCALPPRHGQKVVWRRGLTFCSSTPPGRDSLVTAAEPGDRSPLPEGSLDERGDPAPLPASIPLDGRSCGPPASLNEPLRPPPGGREEAGKPWPRQNDQANTSHHDVAARKTVEEERMLQDHRLKMPYGGPAPFSSAECQVAGCSNRAVSRRLKSGRRRSHGYCNAHQAERDAEDRQPISRNR